MLGGESIDPGAESWDDEFPEATKFFYIIVSLIVLTLIIGVIAIVKACKDKRKVKKQVLENHL